MNKIELYLTEDRLHYKDVDGKLWCQTTEENNPKFPLIKFVEKSVEELAAFKYPNWYTEYDEGIAYNGFIKGYNLAKSSDKKYTEDDIREALYKNLKQVNGGNRRQYISFNELIQSLNQPKRPSIINLEMEQKEIGAEANGWGFPIFKDELKTTFTPEGKVIIVKI